MTIKKGLEVLCEEKAHYLFDQIDAVVYVADVDNYEVLYVNEYTRKIFGNEIIGKQCYKVLRKGQTKPCELCPNNRLYNPEVSFKGVYRWEYINNFNNRWYDSSVKPIQWDKDRRARFEIAFDITNRKRDEKSLFYFLNQQKILYTITKVFNTLEDFEQKVQKFLRMLGGHFQVDRGFIVEQLNNNTLINSHSWYKTGTVLKIDYYLNISEASINRGNSYLLNKGVIKWDDIKELDMPDDVTNVLLKYASCGLIIVPIIIDNKPFGFLGFDRIEEPIQWSEYDINLLRTASNILSEAFKRKSYEEEIIKNQLNLEKLNATKDKFFSILAHDLKNPFNTIIGFAELMLLNYEKISDEKRKQYIDLILKSSKNSFSLLENLLHWSRSQTNSYTISKVNFSLHKLIEQNINLLKSQAGSKKIELVFNSEEDVNCYADLNMIDTVIRNLITNAIKFSYKDKKVLIDYALIDGMVKIQVKDEGIGIRKDVLKTLFKIDKSHSTEGTQGETGTGLGLILCKEFVELNEGQIIVESEPEKGSVFSFTIPATA